MQLAHQLGETVAALRIEHATADAAACVTVSLGVSSKPAGGAGSAEALLREADTQLDRAKAQGRNQACGAALA